MVISRRLNVIEGRHADSWARVIGGKLFLFIHGHSPTTGGNTRARMVTLYVSVWELEWDEFKELAEAATFMRRHAGREGSVRRHAWRAS